MKDDEQKLTQSELQGLRDHAMIVLRVTRPRSGSSLASGAGFDKGNQRLKRPSATYETVDSEGRVTTHRRPSHDQWTTTHHATATRRSGRSKEVIEQQDYCKAHDVRALCRLDRMHILSIKARYHGSKSERQSCRLQLVRELSRDFRGAVVQQSARQIAWQILCDRTSRATLATLFNVKEKDWNGSALRKQFDKIKKRLSDLDEASLIAWKHEIDIAYCQVPK